MPEHFKTTADVFATVTPQKDGSYRCPIKNCPSKPHANSKDFGRHLAVKHGIRSPNHATRIKKDVQRKHVDLPSLTVKRCPNCGFDIEQLEQAAALLRGTK